MRLAVLLMMTGLLVAPPRSGAAQELRSGIRFVDADVPRTLTEAPPPPALAAAPAYAPELEDSAGPGVWTAAVVGAGVGAAVGGSVGWVAYPDLLDPWLTRGQHTALSAAEGVVVGAGVGVAVALIRRWWARSGAGGTGGG